MILSIKMDSQIVTLMGIWRISTVSPHSRNEYLKSVFQYAKKKLAEKESAVIKTCFVYCTPNENMIGCETDGSTSVLRIYGHVALERSPYFSLASNQGFHLSA